MNIWLTTNKGFLGQELLPRLSKKYNVFSTTRQEVNLLESNQVDSYIKDNSIDIIIHNAIKGGRRTKEDDASVAYENILMYENIAKNSNKVNRIINFDSAACFDRRYNIFNYKETDLGKNIPIDFYGFSKMNIALRSLQVKNSYNLRIFNCFGPTETPDRMTKANILRYIKGEDLVVHKNKYMDIFYIEDLWTVLEYYLDNEFTPKDLNLTYEKKNTLYDVAEMVNNLDIKKSKIVTVQEGMDNSYTGDFSLINTLNFKFLGIEYGLSHMYNMIINGDI